MHIPDNLLDPRVATTTLGLGALGLALSLRKLRGQLGDRATVLMGIMSACVFAAQMVNFPLGVAAVSGHLLGGVLAAVMLGPWAGSCVIATVLFVQCLLCGDGGLTALGANYLNMGLLGSVVGYAIYDPVRRGIGGDRGVLIGSMVAAWFAVILASGAIAIELGATRSPREFVSILGWMVLIHAAIGLGEALITGLVVRFVLLTRPDLIHRPGPAGPGIVARWGSVGLAGLGVAAAIVIFLAPIASEHPDGLEAVGRRLGFFSDRDGPPAVVRAPLVGYEMPGLERSKGIATAAAGLVGTLVVFGAGLGLARALAPTPRTEGIAADAV